VHHAGSLKAGGGVARPVVKRSRVLETEVDADVPYEETRLARQATRARPRLAILLLVGAAGFALEAALEGAIGMGLIGIALAFTATGVWKGRLGGVVAAAFAAVLAFLIPLAFLFLGERSVADRVILGFVMAWAALLFPDVLTLVRDAELQYAYGRWARRDG